MCWLKYAIMRNQLTLLTNRIDFCEQKLTIRVNNIPNNYFSYVLLLDQTDTIRGDRYRCDIDTNYRFGGFGMCHFWNQISDIFTLWAKKQDYKHSTKNILHYDIKNYNITLRGEVAIKFINRPNGDTVYVYNGKNYMVYRNIPSTNKFEVYSNDLSTNKVEVRKLLDLFKEEFTYIRKDMDSGKYDKILEIYNDNDKKWTRQGANTRTWNNECVYSISLNKLDDNYVIS